MLRAPFVAGLLVGGIALSTLSTAAFSQVSFANKTVTIIVTSATGGGTDMTGRLIGRFLGQYLPGSPSVVVQNVPGANGIVGVASFVRKGQSDGLTSIISSNSTIDPVIYRNANAQYDTTAIKMVGGIGTGGTIMFVSRAAENRLHDRSAAPVVIGNIGPVPRAGMLMALWGIEYLGWNAKWVTGYPGSNEVMLALDRGEVDLSSTGYIGLIEDRLKAGSLKILLQTGSLENGRFIARPEFGDAPLFHDEIQGKISDPVAQKAFNYWVALTSLDKWWGMAPETPGDILEAYRDAFRKFSADKEFFSLGEKVSDGFGVMDASAAENFVRILADTPPEALTYLTNLMRKQGLRVQ